MTSVDSPGQAHGDPLVIGGAPIWEDEPMPTRPVRAKLGRLTFVLMALVVATGTYYLGVLSEKNSMAATSGSTGNRGAGAGGAANTGATDAPAASGANRAGGGGGATAGTVKLVDGTNLYVTDAVGTVVKIATTPASVFTITATGTIKGVKPGDTVIITGAAGADGTVTATAIRDQGVGGGFGGFGGGRNGGGGGRNGGGGAAPGAGG